MSGWIDAHGRASLFENSEGALECSWCMAEYDPAWWASEWNFCPMCGLRLHHASGLTVDEMRENDVRD